MFKKLEAYRKTVVAFVTANGAAIALVTTSDFSTKQGILTFVLAELSVYGIWRVPNAAPSLSGVKSLRN